MYALYRLLAYSSYVTNFGFYADPLAFVSNGSFMVGAAVGNFISCGAVFALYATGRLKAGGLRYRPPLVVVAVVYLIIAFAPRAFLDEMVTLSFLGVLWGLTVTVIGFTALELLAATASPFALIVQLAGASLLFGAVSFLLGHLPEVGKNLAGAFCALALWPLLAWGRRSLPTEKPARRIRKPLAVFRDTVRECATPILAMAFFELVIGLVNRYAASAHVPFSISNHAPLEGSLICSVLVIAFVGLTAAVPRSRFMYLGVFPGAIAVFLVLPYFGEVWGKPLSSIIYTAYSFTALLSTFCIIRACQRTGDCIYGVAAVLSASMRLCLLIGLGLGCAFAGMTEGDGFVRLSVVGVTCVYVLGVVVVLWALKSSREKSVVEVVEVVRVVEERVPLSFEESVASRVEELVAAHQLSPRERDVLIGLAQGNTAASIARGLHISTSTVQGYIKTLYVKLGVNRKQQVIDLFQK